MIKRVHHKSWNHKLTKAELNQVFYKINTNPKRFDFKEQKPLERYKKFVEDVVSKVKTKLLGKDDEIASQTA